MSKTAIDIIRTLGGEPKIQETKVKCDGNCMVTVNPLSAKHSYNQFKSVSLGHQINHCHW